jgi:DNA-binding MarR family transcriptional regulator
MHNIPNTYPSLHPSEHMTGETESTTKSEAQLLKQLSRMYEASISINDISKELKMDQETVKRLLKRLGYASEI